MLLPSVLSAMPMHLMYTTPVSKQFTMLIDKLAQKFFWDKETSIFPIARNHITRPKENGGLGLKNMSIFVDAFFGKQVAKYLDIRR